MSSTSAATAHIPLTDADGDGLSNAVLLRNGDTGDETAASPEKLRQDNVSLRRTVEQLRKDLKESAVKHTRAQQELEEKHEKELISVRNEARERYETALFQANDESEKKHKADRQEVEKLKDLLNKKEDELQQAISERTKETSTSPQEKEDNGLKDELKKTQRRLDDATTDLRQLRPLLKYAEDTMFETTKELREKLEEQQHTIEQLRLKLQSKTHAAKNPPTQKKFVKKIDKAVTVQEASEDESPTSNSVDNKFIDSEGDLNEEDRKPAAEIFGRRKLKLFGKSLSKASRKTRKRSAAELEREDESDKDALPQGDAKMPVFYTVRILPKIPLDSIAY